MTLRSTTTCIHFARISHCHLLVCCHCLFCNLQLLDCRFWPWISAVHCRRFWTWSFAVDCLQWLSSPCSSSCCRCSCRPTLYIARSIIFNEEASCRGDGLLQRRPPFEEASCGSGDCLLQPIYLVFNSFLAFVWWRPRKG